MSVTSHLLCLILEVVNVPDTIMEEGLKREIKKPFICYVHINGFLVFKLSFISRMCCTVANKLNELNKED